MEFKSPIVITTEANYPQEVNWIVSLFKAGMERLHLRKPQWDVQQCKAFISQIPADYHKNIVLHQHHSLLTDFELGGIHLKEKDRDNSKIDLADFCKTYQLQGKTVSTSFHSIEDIKTKGDYFDYCFLSPVFDSTSKKGYLGKGFNVMHLPQMVVALGGITTKTIAMANNLGYTGVAVLGGIWQQPSPVEAFKELQNIWQNESYES